jgi:hypothetical protein
MPTTKLNSVVMTICAPETKHALQLWLVDELTILAESLGDTVSPERLRIYVHDLSDDLTREQLEIALERARRESRFFPKIAELRSFAGVDNEQQTKVEAEAAWQLCLDFLSRYGLVRYGDEPRPSLPRRVAYALRRIGGLRALNELDDRARPFAFRDFTEGYEQYPIAEQMAAQLDAAFQLPALKSMPTKQLRGDAIESRPSTQAQGKPIVKPIPEPLTETDLRARRAFLRQQIEHCASKERENPNRY